ncbi:hypothetical protein CCP3SC1_430016 [Gammaproteobacteria bacterium]
MTTATVAGRWLVRVLGIGLLVGLLSTAELLISTASAATGDIVGEKRVALVIGNAAYTSGPLHNAANDATDIAATLRELGFRVREQINVGQPKMEEAVRGFADDLRGATVGLFYFSGHGVQIEGRNYLIPVGAHIEAEDEIRYKALDAGFVLDKMEHAGSKINLVILDACRDNPYARSFRSTAGAGLAGVEAPAGSLVAYSTAPGKVAGDGTGHNGTYTKHLLTAMREPGLPAEMMFKRVREAVMKETQNKQVPWESSALIGNDFYFASRGVSTEKTSIASMDSGVAADDANLTLRQLEVITEPTGATVWIDGRKAGQTPLTVVHKIGKVQIHVELAGYRERDEDLFVNEGTGRQQIQLSLFETTASKRMEEPLPPAPIGTDPASDLEIISSPTHNPPPTYNPPLSITSEETIQNNYAPLRRPGVDIFRSNTYPVPYPVPYSRRQNTYDSSQQRVSESSRSNSYEDSYPRRKRQERWRQQDIDMPRFRDYDDPYSRQRRYEHRQPRDVDLPRSMRDDSYSKPRSESHRRDGDRHGMRCSPRRNADCVPRRRP